MRVLLDKPALRLTLLATFLTFSNAYTWPSPKLDALESLRFDIDRHPVASFVQPCTFFLFSVNGPSGRSNVADWIRTAYHDMATHNSTDGTGGMDASIRFPEEQARAENAADGFNNTIRILGNVVNRYISLADALAIGAITAIENCGGPDIPFRGGRIDAAAPNPPGVPQPQDALVAHTTAFKRQGFSGTEMISLVACGHSFGGVQHAPFPTIVPEMNDPNNTDSVAHFDSTFIHFDNNVAKEYIAGTTANPLVVGRNDTTNSDARIFGSDGNVTMRGFAKSPTLFASTCSALFARMLDTVPRGVTLSEVLTPLPVKPDNLQFTLNGDKLTFEGSVRLYNATQNTHTSVSLLYTSHTGATHNHTLTFSGEGTNAPGRPSTAWYAFDDPPLSLDASAGVTSISFLVDGKMEDQKGRGFKVQDGVVFSASSCLFSSPAGGNDKRAGTEVGRVDVGVRTSAGVSRVFMEEEGRDGVGRVIVKETDFPPPPPASASAKSNSTSTAYAIWSLNVTQAAGAAKQTIGAEIEGVKVSTGRVVVLADLPAC
ncbi:heme peroxidase [Mycena polygramma]|nr:heme peroxidase [Mycena polygramma]